jgi:4-hydroxybenzoate polyprenyltransferase
MAKWWTYQRERFPLLQHGPLVFAFSFSALAYSRRLRGEPGWPEVFPIVAAFASCLLFFLQLRIADEFKDAEEDAKYRPYRPVPRGLVTLPQLAYVFGWGCVVQLLLAVALAPGLLKLLFLTWFYLAGMTREFGAREWLKARPMTYMVSHMAIMPLIDLYATSCDWLASGARPGPGLAWFLLASLFNGMNIEIGRKIRASADEEDGVQTYSSLYGPRRAVALWFLVLALTTAFALMAAHLAHLRLPVAIALGGAALLAIFFATRYLRGNQPGSGKAIETMAGVWTLALYLSLGSGPWWSAI